MESDVSVGLQPSSILNPEGPFLFCFSGPDHQNCFGKGMWKMTIRQVEMVTQREQLTLKAIYTKRQLLEWKAETPRQIGPDSQQRS